MNDTALFFPDLPLIHQPRDQMLHVHWKPVVFLKNRRKPSGRPTVDPHGRRPRAKVISLCYLLAHWVEFLIGSHLYFRRTIFRNGLVLIDRYHYDFLVDQRRYRLCAPPWLVRVLFRFVKAPDLVFLFDAPAEVLQARKQEVPAAESARQAEAYRILVQTLPQGRILDAAQPVETVAEKMLQEILSFLDARAKDRHPHLATFAHPESNG